MCHAALTALVEMARFIWVCGEQEAGDEDSDRLVDAHAAAARGAEARIANALSSAAYIDHNCQDRQWERGLPIPLVHEMRSASSFTHEFAIRYPLCIILARLCRP
jgi:hypothetical protein